MLSKVVTHYLEERFSDKIERVEHKEGCAPFLRIKPEDPGFGDIELYDDGDEVMIIFGRFTIYEDQQVMHVNRPTALQFLTKLTVMTR